MIRYYQFYRASIITVILLYVLVLVGGFVRITESGDDCPDWPKSYGSWFPPLSIKEIPDEYISDKDTLEDLNVDIKEINRYSIPIITTGDDEA